MQVSENGRQLIERNEGCVLHAYRDVVGVLTIGYGCTGRGVYEGETITQSEADQMLADRLADEFEPGVGVAIGDTPTTQSQFDAMVSLAFNIGLGHFKTSSVLRLHNEQSYAAAADAFLLWNKAGGRILSALTRRRNEERAMYLSGAMPQEELSINQKFSPGGAHYRILRLKSPWIRGDDVTELQNDLGISPNGTFDDATDQAVREFQSENDLVEDGIVGPKTWAALERI